MKNFVWSIHLGTNSRSIRPTIDDNRFWLGDNRSWFHMYIGRDWLGEELLIEDFHSKASVSVAIKIRLEKDLVKQQSIHLENVKCFFAPVWTENEWMNERTNVAEVPLGDDSEYCQNGSGTLSHLERLNLRPSSFQFSDIQPVVSLKNRDVKSLGSVVFLCQNTLFPPTRRKTFPTKV